MPVEKIRVRFAGNVQGVGFRFTVQEICRSLKVLGWVQNEPDGTVQSEMWGTCEQLDRAVESIRAARASNLQRTSVDRCSDSSSPPATFEIRR